MIPIIPRPCRGALLGRGLALGSIAGRRFGFFHFELLGVVGDGLASLRLGSRWKAVEGGGKAGGAGGAGGHVGVRVDLPQQPCSLAAPHRETDRVLGGAAGGEALLAASRRYGEYSPPPDINPSTPP